MIDTVSGCRRDSSPTIVSPSMSSRRRSVNTTSNVDSRTSSIARAPDVAVATW